MNLEMMSDRREHPLEAIKIGHQELSQDSIYTLNLFLESWRIWRFLMYLEMVSDRTVHPLEASVKVTSRYNCRNHVQKQAKVLKRSVTYGCKDTQTHRQTFPIVIILDCTKHSQERGAPCLVPSITNFKIQLESLLLVVFSYCQIKTETLIGQIVDKMNDFTVVNQVVTKIWIVVDNHRCYGVPQQISHGIQFKDMYRFKFVLVSNHQF